MNTPPSNTFQLHLSEPGTNRPDNSVLTPYALEKGDQDDSHPVVFRRRVVTVNMDSDSVSTIQMREMMRQFIEGSRKVLLDKLFWGSPTDPSVLDQITHSYGGSEISRFEVTDSVVDGDLYKTLWAEFTIKDHGSTHPVIQAVLSGIPFKLELYPVELTTAVEDPCHSTQIHRYRSLDHYVVLADFDHTAHTYRTRFEGPDKDGWYTGVVGAVCHGANNLSLQSVKQTLENPESDVNQRLAGEGLFGEWGSIDFSQYQSNSDAISRTVTIKPKNIAIQIGQLWLDESYGQNRREVYNQEMAAIMGKVRPYGPYADMAEQVLNGAVPGRVTFRSLTYKDDTNHPYHSHESRLVKLITCDIKPINLD